MPRDAGSPFQDPEDPRFRREPARPPPLPRRSDRPWRARPYRLPFGEVMGRCFSIWGRNLLPFTLLTAAVYSPLVLAGALFYRSDPTRPAREWFESLVLPLADGILLTYLLTAALTYGVVEQLRGRCAPIGRCLAVGVSRILPLLATVLLLFLGILGGMLLLIVPGIILAVVWYVAVPVAVVERPGVTGALGRSAFLTRGNRWGIFGLATLMALVLGFAGLFVRIAAIAAFGLSDTGFLLEGEESFWVGQGVGLLLRAPTAVVPAVIYSYLRTGKEGADPAELAAVFE